MRYASSRPQQTPLHPEHKGGKHASNQLMEANSVTATIGFQSAESCDEEDCASRSEPNAHQRRYLERLTKRGFGMLLS